MRTGQFTGWHAFFTIAGGFAIVFAVNAVLAVMAIRTNPATVVDNSYTSSQHFNTGLAEGRAQQQLGWTVTARNDGDGLQLQAEDALGLPLTRLKGYATITHPLGAEPAQTRDLAELADGHYSAGTLPPGRWIVEFRLQRGGQNYYLKKRFDGRG